MRARELVLLIVLATPAATMTAAAVDSAWSFAISGMARDGDDLLLTLQSRRQHAADVSITLYVDDALVAPAIVRDQWGEGRSETFRFPVGNATMARMRVHYFPAAGGDRTDTFDIRIPPHPDAEVVPRVELFRAERPAATALDLVVRSVGGRASGPGHAWLEDADGARIGSPLHASLPPLGVDDTARLSFTLSNATTSATLVMEHDGETRRTTFALPAAPDERARLEVARAALVNDTAVVRIESTGAGPSGAFTVTIEDADGQRIGDPLQRRHEGLATGDAAEFTFVLPSSTREVLVALSYADRIERVATRLTRSGDAGSAELSLATELPSRDAQPGDSVSYNARIHNAGADALVTLSAEGLPAGYETRFAVSGSAVTSLFVPAGESRDILVTLRLPDAASREVGQRLPFRVIATSEGATAQLDLALTVRGAGRLDLQGENWFASGRPGEAKTLALEVRNPGSAPLLGVSLSSTLPAGWKIAFSPATIDRLDPGARRVVEATVTPAADAGSGRYVLDVTAAAADISSRARSLSFEISEAGGSSLGWIAAAAVAGVIAVALIVKLRRK